jgi:ring-1,2-phenylacetyl-CoA epoxidase subunit PaaE
MKNNFNTLTVSSKIFLTEDAVLLSFNVPEEIKEKYAFENGQYLTLEAIIENQKLRRSYSICSSPEENQISIVVKAIKDGVFSNYIKNSVVAGDEISVASPEGHFRYHKNKNSSISKVLCIAAGSGITPIISIIKGILFNDKNTEVTLLFGNKSRESTIFYDELQKLSQKYKDRFNLRFIFSQNIHENHDFGRIDEIFIANFLSQETGQVFDHYFLCGPEDLVDGLKIFFTKNGEIADKIKYELFFSQASEEEVITEDENKSVELEVISDGESISFEISNRVTLLESLLEQGYNANYSCQKGNCSSCVAKVLSGSVKMKQNNALMDFEVEDGYILCCQSIPKSSKLILSFDEY